MYKLIKLPLVDVTTALNSTSWQLEINSSSRSLYLRENYLPRLSFLADRTATQ